MKILALDSSTQRFSLALCDGGKALRQMGRESRKVLSNEIMPLIEKILKKQDWELSDIDAFAVGLGPGSFTSLRVGLSTAKGLAFALGKKVAGVSSLDVLAMGVEDEAETVCPFCDARRGMVYTCLYKTENGKLKKLTDYQLVKPEGFLKTVKGEVVFAGDGVDVYRELINKRVKNAVIADKRKWQPQAKFLAPLVLPKLKRMKTTGLDKLDAIYLYPDDCQVAKR